jgi:hypothetical protein
MVTVCLQCCFAIFCVVLFQFFAASMLPMPFSLVHIVFVSSVVLLFIFEHGAVVWITFCALFCIELFTSGLPFGITLLSGTLAVLFTFWLHSNVLTNRSWYAAGLLAAASVVAYRTAYLLFWAGVAVSTHSFISLRLFFLFVGWELLFTTVLSAALVRCLAVVLPSLDPKPLQDGLFRILSSR